MSPLMPISSSDEEQPRSRRRSRHLPEALEDDERSKVLAGLAGRALPNFDFFLFTVVSALLVVASFAFSSPALQVAAALVAPLLAPLPGLALGAATGSFRYAGRNLLGVLVAALLVLMVTLLGGWLFHLARGIPALPLASTVNVGWPEVLLAVAASAWMSARLARAPAEARLPSAALAFVVFIPLGMAGWQLGAGQFSAALASLLVALVYLGLGFFSALVTYLVLGFRPLPSAALGMWAPAIAGLLATGALLGSLVVLSRRGPAGFAFIPTRTPTPRPTATASLPPTASPTLSPLPTETVTPSPLPSSTRTLTPTPELAIIFRTSGQGAILRDAPAGGTKGYLDEGAQIEIIGGPVVANNRSWVMIRDSFGNEGWLASDLFATLTPSPAP